MTTMKDVAELAKVSIATVSRVLNNSDNVSESRRKQVLNAIATLNYVPNTIAKELKEKNSTTIGLFLPDIQNTFTPTIVDSFITTLSNHNYNVMTCITGFNEQREHNLLSALVSRHVGGIAFLGPRLLHSINNPVIIQLANKFPIIIMDYFDHPQISHVMSDEEEGAYIAVKHLLSLGHRRIALLNGDLQYGTYYHKHQGFLRAFKEFHLTPDPTLMKTVQTDHLGGYQAASELLQYCHRPTAIFTAGDQIAMGVYRAAHENNISIPSQLSVIGFGGSSISLGLYPALSTVSQFPSDIGEEAAMLMMEMITGSLMHPKNIILPPRLMDRSSCCQILSAANDF